MFGVLVVADPRGGLGYLAGFSGMLDGRWDHDGFVPPLFDRTARDAFWPAGEAELAELERAIAARVSAEAVAAAALAAHDADAARARDALAAVHRERRAARRAARADAARVADAAALERESRGDTAEHRRARAERATARAPLAAEHAARAAERRALEARRAARSDALLAAIHATYLVPSARGAARPLRALFAPELPPGGAGDCAAPKLFAHAFRHGLRPVALAELWLGAPPLDGGRRAGAFYPACRGKCGPLLAHMLDGLDVEPAPLFGGGPIAADQPHTVYEDDCLVVVDKPCGLLSVPGRSGRLRDSVATRLRARYPAADAEVVHRLDLDTSGLLLAAKDAATHAALQAQFARRAIDKRYVALLDGAPVGEHGVIELALRVDLDDRPRQLHDPVHGKAAITEWRVLSRAAARTRVALVPRTGRTHQLRVHAAHPDGLGAPIVGDRLYGRRGERLMLHAERLAFAHPRDGRTIELTSPAPF